jgi:hypothetical protein
MIASPAAKKLEVADDLCHVVMLIISRSNSAHLCLQTIVKDHSDMRALIAQATNPEKQARSESSANAWCHSALGTTRQVYIKPLLGTTMAQRRWSLLSCL